LTENQIAIGTFNGTPFFSADGRIDEDNLQLLLVRCNSDQFVREIYDYPGFDVSVIAEFATIEGQDVESFQKAELYLNRVHFNTLSLSEIARRIKDSTGTLALHNEVLDRLLAGEQDPVKLLSGNTMLTDGQAAAALGDRAYFAELVARLSEYSTRNRLIHQVTTLQPTLRDVIETQLRAAGDANAPPIGRLLFWLALGFGSIMAPIATLVTDPPANAPDMAWIVWFVITLSISVVGVKIWRRDFRLCSWYRKSAEMLRSKDTT
jgi:hypothetical protein